MNYMVISKAEVKSDLCYPIYEDNRSKNNTLKSLANYLKTGFQSAYMCR